MFYSIVIKLSKTSSLTTRTHDMKGNRHDMGVLVVAAQGKENYLNIPTFKAKKFVSNKIPEGQP